MWSFKIYSQLDIFMAASQATVRPTYSIPGEAPTCSGLYSLPRKLRSKHKIQQTHQPKVNYIVFLVAFPVRVKYDVTIPLEKDPVSVPWPIHKFVVFDSPDLHRTTGVIWHAVFLTMAMLVHGVYVKGFHFLTCPS